MIKKNIWPVLYLGSILILLCVLVFPTYFSLDEPNILWLARTGNGWTTSYTRFVSEGRAIYGAFQLWSIQTAGTLANLKYLRILSIPTFFFFCRMIFLYLKKNGISESVAFIISAMVFSLPGISVMICWAESSLIGLAAIMSFYAGTLLVSVFEKNLGGQALSKGKENAYVIAAIALNVISLFIYQGLALVIVIPAFFKLVLNSNIPTKNRMRFFILIVVSFIVSIGLYYLIFKNILSSSNIKMTNRSSASGIDVVGKISWFFYMLTEAAKLHLVLFKGFAINNIFSIIIASVLIRDLIKKRFLDLTFLLLFSILVVIPHLMIHVSWTATRNFMLISTLLVFYSAVRIFEVVSPPSIKSAAAIGLVFIALMGFNIEEGWVKPMHKDYVAMYNYAQSMPTISKDTVLVIVTPPLLNMHEKNSILKKYADEFLIPEFYIGWPTEPSLKCLYQDTHPGILPQTIDKLIQVRMDSVKLTTSESGLKQLHLNLNYQ